MEEVDRILHHVPLDDSDDHYDSLECPCGAWDYVENGVLHVVHKSYDGREWKVRATLH